MVNICRLDSQLPCRNIVFALVVDICMYSQGDTMGIIMRLINMYSIGIIIIWV